MDGTEDALPTKVWVDITFVLNSYHSDDVVNYLVDAFHHSISLCIVSGNQLPVDTALMFDSATVTWTLVANSLPLSMTISVGQGCQVGQVNSR